MPYLKKGQKDPPLAKRWDIKAQKCGLRHTVYSVNGDEYKGEWMDNKKHGKKNVVCFCYLSGVLVVFPLKVNQSGKGTHIYKKDGAIYEGDWKNGKRDGYGTYSKLLPGSNEYVRKYSGGWKNGKKHGYGTFFYSNSAVYEGHWSEDKRSGWGRMHDDNGDIYEGEWMEGKHHGQGTFRFENGNSYEGTWKDGKKNGYGKFHYLNKGQLYEGFWVDGVAKTGTLSDFGRDEAPMPTTYPIPKVYLLDTSLVLMEAQSVYHNQCCTVDI